MNTMVSRTDFWHWLTHNASSAPNRVMARYLRRRGWVVFYLEEQCRQCSDGPSGCWLHLYVQGERQPGDGGPTQ